MYYNNRCLAAQLPPKQAKMKISLFQHIFFFHFYINLLSFKQTVIVILNNYLSTVFLWINLPSFGPYILFFEICGAYKCQGQIYSTKERPCRDAMNISPFNSVNASENLTGNTSYSVTLLPGEILSEILYFDIHVAPLQDYDGLEERRIINTLHEWIFKQYYYF